MSLMTTNSPLINPLVRKLEGFNPLSEDDCAALQAISSPVEMVPAQTDLVREGEKPKGVVLLIDGMAYRYKTRKDGNRQIVAYLLPGDMGDLDAGLLDEADHSLGTFSACKVVWIDPGTLAEIKQDHSEIARAMRMSTLVDEATLREWLLNVGRRSSVERLAHLFSELLVRHQAVGLAEANSFELRVTPAELGDTTGLSTVHVNRAVQELRRQGLIAFDGKILTVLDMAQLKALAEFSPNYLHLSRRSAA